MRYVWKIDKIVTKGALVINLLCLLNCTLFGDWKLLADFEEYAVGEIFSEANQIGFHATSSSGLDKYEIVADPIADKSKTLSVNPGRLATSLSILFNQIALPNGGIAPMATSTVSFDYIRLGSFTRPFYLGTTDLPLEYDEYTGLQSSPGRYSDFNSVIEVDENGLLKIYDEDQYYESVNYPVLGFGQWYRFWLVVRNYFTGENNNITSVGEFELFVKGPDDEVPKVVAFDNNMVRSQAKFRRKPLNTNGAENHLIWLMIATTEISLNPEKWLIDNIYYSVGESVNDPDMSWGWYNYSLDRDCDTGSFLSWINVAHSPWLWSYSLNGWIYMEEPEIETHGGWGFFLK